MSPSANDMFDRLMAVQDIATRADDVALQMIGVLVDLSGDLKREDGITRALEWCDTLGKHELTGGNGALLEYFRANAWGNLQSIKHQDRTAAWNWEQPEFLKQVLHLRRARRHEQFAALDPLRRCQIATNLGNQLNSLGRFVEALPNWSRALSVNSRFGKALGNRAYGLLCYARALYDHGHRAPFLLYAHENLCAALSPEAVYDSEDDEKPVKSFFARIKVEIESAIDIDAARKSIRMDGYETGRSKEERAYRKWVLENRLFLNPLNDLGSHSIAARDILVLPAFTTQVGEPPTLIGLFNQMKQEFASARWLLFEGMQASDMHFSDRDVLLYNTLDYPSYCLAVEKVKVAYRVAYSIFDKLAFFLNDYARLGVKPNQVYFRSIWYENRDLEKRIVRSRLAQSENWPLRGLFWLSKDLFDPELQDVMEPEAQELHVIRNCLEHSYLKVHEMLVPRLGRDEFADAWVDRLAYSVRREDFVEKTLHVFRMVRAAMIYLSLGMHREEQRRATNSDDLVMPMTPDRWDDEWKK